MEFYKQCNHTSEDAANYTEMFKAFIELGGKYPSKFVEAAPVSILWRLGRPSLSGGQQRSVGVPSSSMAS